MRIYKSGERPIRNSFAALKPRSSRLLRAGEKESAADFGR
jgi:hypothetical protein